MENRDTSPSCVWHFWCGQDKQERPAATPFLSLPAVGTSTLSQNPHHKPMGALGYHFCYRLSERRGLAQGHAEPGLESKVLPSTQQSISGLTL